jgi:hypothetical protein
MATVIDSLVVKLGLDPSGFKTGKAELDKGLDDAGKRAEKTGKQFKSTASDALKFFAILGGSVAIKNFAKNAMETSAALGLLSKNLGMGVETVSAWSNAAELAGGTVEGLQGTLDMLSKAQTELMLTGQSGLIPFFSALGISMADANGKARPVTDLLADMAGRFAGMDRTTANNMGRMMGIDQGTMNLLLRGRREVELMVKAQKEYNAVTKKQADDSARIRQSIVASRQSFEAFGRELLVSVMPTIEKVFAAFEDVGTWMRDNKDFVEGFLIAVAAGLGAIALAAAPVNKTAIVVAGLAAAFAALYDDYKVWSRGGESLFDWSNFVKGIDLAKFAARAFKDMLGELFYRVFALGGALANLVTGDYEGVVRNWEQFIEGTGKQVSDWGKDDDSATGKGTAKDRAIDFFMNRGWSKHQAVGIAANLQRESNFNIGAVGDSGKAYGLAQWHPDRQAAFKRVFGKDIRQSSEAEQLHFIQWELTKGQEAGAGARLRRASTAEEAAQIFSMYYERPRDAASEALRRGRIAASMMSGIPGASGFAAPAPGTTTGRPAAQQGGAVVSNTVGQVNIYTQATDAEGIAKDAGRSMEYLFVTQGNRGFE